MVSLMRIDVPTTLSQKSNAKFRALYKKHFGEDISVDKANEEAHRLLSFFAILFEKNPKYHKSME